MALEYGVYLGNCLLRDSDWAGMAHSVEIRTPLVDASFFAAIGARQGFGGKLLGKPTFAAVPSRALPRGIVERRKTGFLIPLQQWLQSQSSTGHGERGLRAWARYIAASFRVEGVGSPVGDVPFAVERR
jgi:asparagine synthase (glutamine-hydrolysing)